MQYDHFQNSSHTFFIAFLSSTTNVKHPVRSGGLANGLSGLSPEKMRQKGGNIPTSALPIWQFPHLRSKNLACGAMKTVIFNSSFLFKAGKCWKIFRKKVFLLYSPHSQTFWLRLLWTILLIETSLWASTDNDSYFCVETETATATRLAFKSVTKWFTLAKLISHLQLNC